MPDLNISLANQSHQSIVLNILNETQQWLWSRGINQWTIPFSAEWIDQSIASAEFFIATIDNDQEPVAVFRLTDSDRSIWEEEAGHAYYIHSLAVRGAWRGQGLGTQLLDWIEAYAIKNERQSLRLDCLAENRALCRYYIGAGFIPLRKREIHYHDHPSYTAQLFEKPVGK